MRGDRKGVAPGYSDRRERRRAGAETRGVRKKTERERMHRGSEWDGDISHADVVMIIEG